MTSRGGDTLFTARFDTSQFDASVQRMIEQMIRLQQQLTAMGQAGESRALGGFGSTQLQEIKRAEDAIRQLNSQFQALAAIRERLTATGQRSITLSPQEQQLLGGLGGQQRRVQATTVDVQLEKTRNQLRQEGINLTQAQAGMQARLNTEERRANELAEQRTLLRERLNALLSGSQEQQAIRRRIALLDQETAKLQQQRAIVQSQVAAGLGRAGTRRENTRAGIEERITATEERQERVVRRLEGAYNRLNAAREKGRGVREAEQQIADLIQRQGQLTQRLADLNSQLAERRGAPAASLGQAAEEFGASEELERIDRDLASIQEQRIQAILGSLGPLTDQFGQIRNRVEAINTELAEGNLTQTERNRLTREMAELLSEADRIAEQLATEGVPQAVDPEVFRQQQFAQVAGLEKLFVQAFDDIGRRFVATLQFAISGALIFGVQQFLREFAEAAIDVERTFADIASALEFDLADEGIQRGTTEFDRQVEDFRRDVVELANEFNVLPEVANRAAFQMSARFRESTQAIAAVRAQLLATKVSTIDQEEALRALTATAEGFAAASLDINESLSLEERLLERERVAAEGYSEALDNAVLIQQRFGIAVEDTLEGGARAAETFGQLGFTLEQTQASVAAVSFALGQTGVNVAERLNRAFGGITDPQVRDELLAIAAASERFNLSLSDFASGAEAVRVIDEQIRSLQKTDPATALSIREVLGQRRETEVVAAFFGTADLRRAIEESLDGAAGAAERRFSFLESTVAERIQSILVQFQEMAQLFERLGGLNPFKAVLVGAEATLAAINHILRLLEGAFGLLDRIGESIGIRLGEGLKDVLSVVLAIGVGIKAMSAAATAVRIANAAQIGLAAAQSAAVSGAVPGAVLQAGITAAATQQSTRLVTVLGTVGTAFAAVGKEMKEAPGLFSRLRIGLVGIIGVIGKGIIALQNALARGFLRATGGIRGGEVVAGAAGQRAALLASRLTLAAGALILFTEAVRNSAQTSREAGVAQATARSDARTATRRAALAGDFESDAERRIFELGQTVDNLMVQMDENVLGTFETGIARTFPAFNEKLREELGGWGPALGATFSNLLGLNFGRNEIIRASVQGSKEWWEEIIGDAQDAFLQAQLDELERSLREAGPSQPEFQLGVDPTGGLFGTPAFTQPTDIQRAQLDVARARQAVAEADSTETRQAAQAALDAAELTLDELFGNIDEFGDKFESTLDAIRERVAEISRQAQLGTLVGFQVPAQLAIEQQRLEEHLQNLRQQDPSKISDLPQQIAETESELEQVMLERVQAILAAFGPREARISRIEDPVQQLEERLQLLRDQLAALGTEFARVPEALAILEEIRFTQEDLREAAGQAAVTAAERKVALARTTEEWIAAIRELQAAREALLQAEIDAYNEIVANTHPADRKFLPPPPEVNTEAQAEADFQRAQEDQDIADRLLDEAQREAAARVRLANPIRSRLAAVNAQIAALQVLLASGTLFGVEALEAQVKMQELLADRVEAQVANVSAYIRLQAGANNQIKSLQAELTIISKELENAAELFGEQDAQYSELALRQEQLRAQLVNAMLSLRDLNRRLSSDITNDFEQAQLDLVAAMEALANAGDIGELERAQLELRKQQAAAAAEKAFFDDRLFQLRFAFETGALSLDGYKAALQRLLESVDTSTQQGKETFLQIQAIIDGLSNDISDMQFNIPAEIRLPTLFEVRRALAADQMGVNYMDNRQVNVIVDVSSAVQLEEVLRAIDDAFGEISGTEFRRSGPGGAGIVIGGF